MSSFPFEGASVGSDGAVHMPRSAFENNVLPATLALALLIHIVLLFAYTTFVVDAKSAEYSFFSDVQLVPQTTQVTLAEVKPKPTPPPVPQATPPPAAPKQPPVPQAVKPRQNPIPNPKPAQVAKGSQHPGPKQYSPVRKPVTDVPPPVVASNHGTGPAIPVGNGHGAEGGDPNGRGVGDGGAQKGDPNGTKGGDPNGGGSNGGERTISAPNYSNYDHMPAEIRPNVPPPEEAQRRAATARNWQELAPIWGIDYGKVAAAPHVDPYCLGQVNPNLQDQDKLNGKTGRVTIISVIDENGTPTPEIVSSGDPVLDRIAFYIAKNTRWLPALAYGKPVAVKVQYELTFTTYNGP